MFNYKEPCSMQKAWMLSISKDKKMFSIPEEITRYVKSHHICGIDFLYQNYVKQFKGAILNEEDGFNMQFQVSVLLNSISETYDGRFSVLVICPDELVINWHYHLNFHGKFDVEIVDPTISEHFEEDPGKVLLLPFSKLKLADHIADCNFFAIVIDRFDSVANKRIMNKLCGQFNIGLTERNFYTQPDQKLQWTMLNWCNPGSVGKLSRFYGVDNDNFANFRDNYRHWWFRLTWNFCESFQRPSDEKKEVYRETLSKWSITHSLPVVPVKVERKSRKRICHVQIIQDTVKEEFEDDIIDSKHIKIENEGDVEVFVLNNLKEEKLSENVNVPNQKCEIKSELNLDLLENIGIECEAHENNDNCQENSTLELDETTIAHDQSSTSSVRRNSKDEDDNVFLNIIKDRNQSISLTLDHKTQLETKKRLLLSQIYEGSSDLSDSFEIPNEPDDDSEFLKSLKLRN